MRFDKTILILTPTALPSVTGNAINTERWRILLSQAGAQAEVVAAEKLTQSQLAEKIEYFKPDIIHSHHAIKTGMFFLDETLSCITRHIPIVLSLPGTDINIGLKLNRNTVAGVLNLASAIICQSKAIEEIAKQEFPELRNLIFYIPRSVIWFGEEHLNIREIAKCGKDEILFFHPAGIRPVKGNLECLEYFELLHGIRQQVRILFAGPLLDFEYSGRFLEKINKCSEFAAWVSSIPPPYMKSAYKGADVILNTSFSEGISTVLIEALSMGKPVLASDIPGNRWFLMNSEGEKPCGLMYDIEKKEDFIDKAIELIDNEILRMSIMEDAFKKASSIPKPEEEADRLIYVYKKAMDYL